MFLSPGRDGQRTNGGIFYVGFWRGEDRERGFLRGNLSFWGKKGSPAPPPKKAAFTRSAPRRAGQAAYEKMQQGTRSGVRGFGGRTFLSGERKVPPHPFQRKPLLCGLPRGERVRPHTEGCGGRRGTENGGFGGGASQAAGFARPPHPPWGGRAFRLSWGERERGLLSPERRPLSQKNKSAIILQSGFPRARILRPRSDPRPGFHRCS